MEALIGGCIGCTSLFLSDALLLSPFETLKSRKQLKAANITVPELQRKFLWRGQMLGLGRNLARSVVTVAFEQNINTFGVVGGLLGVVATHPLDTLRIRLITAPEENLKQLSKKGDLYAGLGWSIASGLSLQVLVRFLNLVFGSISPGSRTLVEQSLAVGLAMLALTPLDTFAKVAQTKALLTPEDQEKVSSPKELCAGPLVAKVSKLYQGCWWALAEAGTVVFLRYMILIGLLSLIPEPSARP